LLLHPFNVFKAQLVLDDFHVAQGIDVTLDMNYLRVVKGAYDLKDAIDGPYVREERVSKPSTG
jgi:hypothetical protein